MNIDKITLTNITSFEGTHTIDFCSEPLRSASLFAIAGDTGAGKSSLLDAICLALYNRAPRLDQSDRLTREQRRPDEGLPEKLGLGDPRGLMRRGADNCEIVVAFSLPDGSKWEARWACRLKRTGNFGQVERKLCQTAPKKHTIEADLRSLQGEINRIVGLDYEQFTRTVMLAQNSFATFLKAKKDDKSALLEKLTGTELYARISEQVYRLHQEAQQKAENIAQHIEGLLHDQLTPEQVDDLETRNGQIEAKKTLMAEQETLLRKRLDYLRRYSELSRITQEAEEARVTAAREVARHQSDRERLERYDSIQPVRGDYARLIDLKQQLTEADSNRQELEKEKRQIELALSTASEDFDNQQARLHDVEREIADRQGDLNEGRRLEGEIGVETANLQQVLVRQRQTEADFQQTANKRQLLQEQKAQHEETQKQLLLHRQQLAVHRSMFDSYDILREKLDAFSKESRRNSEETKKLHTAQNAIAHTQKELASKREDLHRISARQKTLQQSLKMLRDEAAQNNLQQAEKRLIDMRSRQDKLQQALLLWQRLMTQYETLEQLNADILRNQSELEAQQRDLKTSETLLDTLRINFEQRQREYLLSNNKDIIELRRSLREGMPCPVCGGTHHPYHTETERELGALADTLRENYADAKERYEQQANTTQQLRLSCTELQARIKEQKQQQQTTQQMVDQSRSEWEAYSSLDSSLASSAPTQDRHLRLVFLQQMIESTDRELHTINENYQHLLRNREQTDQQTNELDQLRSRIDELANQNRSLELALGMEQKNAEDADRQIKQSNSSLERLFEDLSNLISFSDWLSDWQKRPDLLLEKINEAYADWNTTLRQTEKMEHTLEQLDENIRNAEATYESAQQRHQQTIDEAETIRQSVERKQERLRQLFGTSSPHNEQQRLNSRLREAKEAVDTTRKSFYQTRDTLTSKTSIIETLFNTRQRLQQAIAGQNSTLDQWLSRYNLDHSPMQLQELGQLFDASDNWSNLRHMLDTLQTQLEIADNNLKTVRAQFLEHQTSPDRPDMERDETESTVTAELSTIAQERTKLQQDQFSIQLTLSKHYSGLKNADLEQTKLDEARQDALEWNRLDQLIGSADGKKFRQIAQSHTFAYLVAAANQQLRSLSPRYRLKQIPGTLAIEVVDRDMMDTQRYVTSLSGGETFVVSLALALALASLSAHGLSIGSLFIDEGFGNLDQESLELVMQALSNLENVQGRKVGVVSHTNLIREQIYPQIRIKKYASGGKSRIEIC